MRYRMRYQIPAIFDGLKAQCKLARAFFYFKSTGNANSLTRFIFKKKNFSVFKGQNFEKVSEINVKILTILPPHEVPNSAIFPFKGAVLQ